MEHSPVFKVFVHKNLPNVLVLHLVDKLRPQGLQVIWEIFSFMLKQRNGLSNSWKVAAGKADSLDGVVGQEDSVLRYHSFICDFSDFFDQVFDCALWPPWEVSVNQHI